MVRHAEVEDLGSLLEMYRDLRTAGLPGCTWSEDYPSDEDIQNDVVSRALYVVETDGRLLGALAREEDEVKELAPCHQNAVSCEISRVAVRRDMQGRGIGFSLLSEALDILKKEGYEVIRLLVCPENAPAYRMYLRAGFVPIGEADKYDVHWVCCEKWL